MVDSASSTHELCLGCEAAVAFIFPGVKNLTKQCFERLPCHVAVFAQRKIFGSYKNNLMSCKQCALEVRQVGDPYPSTNGPANQMITRAGNALIRWKANIL